MAAKAFLDTLIIRKQDKTLHLIENQHKTTEFLKFNFNNLLHRKLGVFRMLLDRKDAIVTEEDN